MIYFIWFLVVCSLIVIFDPFLLGPDVKGGSETIWNVVQWKDTTPKIEMKNNLVMYRGDTQRNAIFNIKPFKNLVLNWKTGRINFGIHSASKASVISDSESLYVGSDTSWFYCYNRQSGKLNWKIYLGEASRGIHSTAALDGDSVYIGSYKGSVYRINKKSGEIIWMRMIGDTAGASPLVTSEYILFNIETYQPNGYLVKLNKSTGEILWKSENLGEQSHSSPALSKDLQTVVIGVNDSTLQGFDFNTGERRWTTKINGPSKSTAWIFEDTAFITSWGKELVKFNTKDGKIIWKAALGSRSQVSPAVSEKYNTVLGSSGNGTLVGIDIESGKIKWRVNTKITSQVSSPVVLQKSKNDEKFLFVCESEKICLIHPATGKIVQSWKVEGVFTGSISLYGNSIYLSINNGGILSYELK